VVSVFVFSMHRVRVTVAVFDIDRFGAVNFVGEQSWWLFGEVS
jgi:hypothetical protein